MHEAFSLFTGVAKSMYLSRMLDLARTVEDQEHVKRLYPVKNEGAQKRYTKKRHHQKQPAPRNPNMNFMSDKNENNTLVVLAIEKEIGSHQILLSTLYSLKRNEKMAVFEYDCQR